MRFQTETPQFKRGDRVVVVASDRYPATVGRTGEVCTVSALHGEHVPDGEFAVDGVRDAWMDLMFGSPTYTADQLRHATADYPISIPSQPV